MTEGNSNKTFIFSINCSRLMAPDKASRRDVRMVDLQPNPQKLKRVFCLHESFNKLLKSKNAGLQMHACKQISRGKKARCKMSIIIKITIKSNIDD